MSVAAESKSRDFRQPRPGEIKNAPFRRVAVNDRQTSPQTFFLSRPPHADSVHDSGETVKLPNATILHFFFHCFFLAPRVVW